MRFPVLPLALLVLGSWSALAQDATETPAEETATGEAAADQATGEDPPQDEGAQDEGAQDQAAEAEAPPAFNGTASGNVMGASLSTPVVCTVAGGSWTVQSDPGATPGEDNNGDGNLVDISASEASGDIYLNVLAGGMYVTFQDSGATFEGNQMRYSVTVSMAGSEDE